MIPTWQLCIKSPQETAGRQHTDHSRHCPWLEGKDGDEEKKASDTIHGVFFQWLHRQSPASLLWFGVLDTVCLMTTWSLPEAKSTFVTFYLYNDMFADPLTNSYVLGRWPQLLGGWEDRSVFGVGMPRIWASANGYYASRFTMLMPKARWHLGRIYRALGWIHDIERWWKM